MNEWLGCVCRSDPAPTVDMLKSLGADVVIPESYLRLPEYKKLVAEHARFHQAAAAVVDKANAGKFTSEDIALGGKSEFGTASTSVVALILNMKKLVPA